MQSKEAYFKPQSNLVRLFVERSGAGSLHSSPEEVMADVIERSQGQRTSQGQLLQRLLDARNIVSVEFADDLSCDGMIEPIGSTLSDGFRMRLRKSVPDVRIRFTMAHEACHTFFYELVPEIKFREHGTDDLEERLCNFGAAVLLIPAASLRARSKKLPVCLDSLDQLAQEYAVSLPTMLLRLRALNLWKCELSLWHRALSGDFVLDRLYGGGRAEWKWHDSSVLVRAFESNEPVFGTSFVYLDNGHGARGYRPIAYNVRRSRSGAIVLWGSGIRPTAPSHPLLEVTKKAQPRRDHSRPSCPKSNFA
jgi:hypothetical protein